jgi:hypothetical protein
MYKMPKSWTLSLVEETTNAHPCVHMISEEALLPAIFLVAGYLTGTRIIFARCRQNVPEHQTMHYCSDVMA